MWIRDEVKRALTYVCILHKIRLICNRNLKNIALFDFYVTILFLQYIVEQMVLLNLFCTA